MISARPSKTRLWRRLRRVLRAHGGGELLDFACADGKSLDLVADLGYEYNGADLDPALIERARRLHPDARFRIADLLDPDTYPDGPFDVVLCTHTLAHLPHGEWPRVLGHLADRLRPGGILVVQGDDVAAAVRGAGRPWARVRTWNYAGALTDAWERAVVDRSDAADQRHARHARGARLRVLQGTSWLLSWLDSVGPKRRQLVVARTPGAGEAPETEAAGATAETSPPRSGGDRT